MAKKICDFCLEEGKGFFNQPQELLGGYYICKNCRKKIESYGLPVKYDLFQLLVTAEPSMRKALMRNWLNQNAPEDVIAKYYKIPNILLHEGEHLITSEKTSIHVRSFPIPKESAPKSIMDVSGRNISNLPDAPEGDGSETAEGMLYETDNALYFLSGHFINCHRLADIIRNPIDPGRIHVLDNKGKNYTYPVAHADLFFLREEFYNMAVEARDNAASNLIYLESDNTMTLTPGLYDVPGNLKAGTYWIFPDDNKNIRILDASGKRCRIEDGKAVLYNGSTVRLSRKYQFRTSAGNH